MGIFSEFEKYVQGMDNDSLLDLFRATRLKCDTATVGSFVTAAAAIPTGGVSLCQGLYTVPRDLWYWKEHRIVKKALRDRGLQIPDRTKRNYAIPAAVGVVAGILGAGADSFAGHWGKCPQTQMRRMRFLSTTIADPGFAGRSVGNDYLSAYDPENMEGHIRNGMQHLAEAGNTILPGGLPLFSENTAKITGQTVAAVAIGELVDRGLEATAPRRRAAKY
ncbi:hypothetical protein RSAG8_11672, partial [Rhizoctonia solani AG-8 WAC10335]